MIFLNCHRSAVRGSFKCFSAYQNLYLYFICRIRIETQPTSCSNRITVKRFVEVNKTYSIFTVTNNNLGFRVQAIIINITLEEKKTIAFFCIQWVKVMFPLHFLFIQIPSNKCN